MLGSPHPSAVQLIDVTAPEETVTFFGFLQSGRLGLFSDTEWSPGETTKVKGVTWFVS